MKTLYATLVATLILGVNYSIAADKPADNPAESKQVEKAKYRPFNGKIKAVDAASITLEGEKARTFQITSVTKIQKDKKPATAADLKVGDYVGGRAREMADGRLEAVTLNVGIKAAGKPAEKPKKDPAK